ncbi:MAG TPA: hypothetical protein VF096_14220 [Azonexus sp.]
MPAPQPMLVALADRESRQILIEAGSTLLVADGCLHLQQPFAWLAETMTRPTLVLGAGQAWTAETGGWIALTGRGSARALLLAPGEQSLWQRIGHGLSRLWPAPATARKLRQGIE